MEKIFKREELGNIELARLWENMQDKKDLLTLLNKTLSILYGDNANPINLQHLNHYIYSANCDERYFSFQIPKKKKGEFRTINAPCSGLKTIQRCLNIIFQAIYTSHPSAYGFNPKHSIVDGATIHIQQKFVFNIDLKDFFSSITAGRLYKRLQSKPFCLNKDIASMVTDLCCYTNIDGINVLPQGAPTSPIITNFICERMDRKLSKLAVAYNLKYTRYADDITFSGMVNVFTENGKFYQSLKHIIEEEEHFKININKTRLLHRGNRQEVTGITVNRKTNVPQQYIKVLRTLIHNWEKDGYEKAQEKFLKHYHPTKNIEGEHHIENIVRGKLNYLKMVKGETDDTYKKLKQRFDNLVRLQQETYINSIIDIWENEGIKNAMEYYEKTYKNIFH